LGLVAVEDSVENVGFGVFVLGVGSAFGGFDALAIGVELPGLDVFFVTAKANYNFDFGSQSCFL